MGSSKSPSPRDLMEHAVAVMRDCQAESRRDKKSTPLVGAVLLKADGSVETASRRELREGDHAEFTLIERKNRASKLDGCVLYCTLEPCAPGARNHPKLSCAERIVLARIKEVWVGIEDPDPTVDRKGIRYLQDHDVDVHMFDRDLQEQIQEANRHFIAQAVHRAEEARGNATTAPVVLSDLEDPTPAARLADFQTELLEKYKGFLSKEKLDDESFHHRLHMQGLLQERNGGLFPTGFGMLVFGQAPRAALPQAGLMGTIHLESGGEETRDFDGPALGTPALALQWLKDKLPAPIDRSQAERGERIATLHELVREGVVNALVHRDYAIAGAKCQLKVYPGSKIEIWSPGLPVAPITLEQLQDFSAPMLSRNPVLHYVFAKMRLAEERGLGLTSMRELSEKAGLPRPAFSYRKPYLVLTLFLEPEAVGSRKALAQLSADDRKMWAWITRQDSITSAEYGEEREVSESTAKRHLKRMTDLGLLQRVGSGPATKYRVVRS